MNAENIHRAVRAAIRPLALAGSGALLVVSTGCGGGDNSSSGNMFRAFPVPTSVTIADVNGDGAPDIVVATTVAVNNSNNSGYASVIIGHPGTQQVTYSSGVHYNITGTDPSSIAAGDLTGSGKVDLVIANFSSGSVSVFLHDPASAGTYLAGTDVKTGGAPNQVVIGDLNGDGKPDLALADFSTTGNVIIDLQDPANPGHFLAATTLALGNPITSVQIGDLNGDGKPDIVAANFDTSGNNGRVSIYYQDPTNPGSFPQHVNFPAGAQPQSVKIADVNGDGLPDLVVANQGPGSDGVGTVGVSVLIQDPANPGTFLPPVTYATPLGAVDVAVADLNGDGKPDLVVANLTPTPTGSISVLLQDPSNPGVFTGAATYLALGQPLGVAIADLNNDGKPDIAVADGNSVGVLTQNQVSAGAFGPEIEIGD